MNPFDHGPTSTSAEPGHAGRHDLGVFIATIAQRGLDLYALLGVAPDATTPLIARRYQHLRALFPTDVSALEPAAARRVALLELAGRALADPTIRARYDRLRRGQQASIVAALVQQSDWSWHIPEGSASAAAPIASFAPDEIATLFATTEPLDMDEHVLRRAIDGLRMLEQAGTAFDNGPALLALCQGLLARAVGDAATATAELRRCVQMDKHMAAGWRGLAALAIARGDYDGAQVACKRGLACQPRHERSLLLLAAACLRNRQLRDAYEAATHIAALRGAPWTAEAVLHEVEGGVQG